jgi:hypothetical protein
MMQGYMFELVLLVVERKESVWNIELHCIATLNHSDMQKPELLLPKSLLLRKFHFSSRVSYECP